MLNMPHMVVVLARTAQEHSTLMLGHKNVPVRSTGSDAGVADEFGA